MRITALLVLALIDGSGVSSEPLGVACPVTRPEVAQPPQDPNADPFSRGPWYINGDRTIWAGWGASPHEGKNKILWIRPQGTQLAISGRRLDAESSPLVAAIPCCYPTGFQATGLTFPSAGCWEIEAKAGSSDLRFVTLVQPKPSDGTAER